MKNTSLIIVGIIAGFTVVSCVDEGSEVEEDGVERTVFNSLSFDKNYSEGIVPEVDPGLFVTLENWERLWVTRSDLQNVTLVSELIPEYPANWIIDYTSVELASICKEVCRVESNSSIEINSAQRELLNSVDMSEEIHVHIKYKSKNDITDTEEERDMKVYLELVPEKEAQIQGGFKQMFADLKNDLTDEIAGYELNPLWSVNVSFTINEKGVVENVGVSDTSGVEEVDKLLKKWVAKMSNWEPAEDAKGNKIKQRFRVMVGTNAC